MINKEAIIQDLEENLDKIDQVPCKLVHGFAPGVYIREVTMYAGSYIIGHYHKTAHLNIMIAGRLLLQKDDGSYEELVAPLMYTAQPGRKIAVIIEDTVWLNIHPNPMNSNDIESLEDEFLDKSEAWKSGAQKAIEYKEFIEESGLDPALVNQISHDESDMVQLPFGSYKIQVIDSKIQGKGLFATGDIERGEIIAPARLGRGRTIAGRYTNHAKIPNASMVMSENGDVYLIAIENINGCIGGLPGDEITVNYSEALLCQP